MNKLWLILILCVIGVNNIKSQTEEKKIKYKVPNVELTDLDGKKVKIHDIINDKKGPIILSFWATWCKPCIRELSSISEVYSTWQEETNVRLIAISIDDSRTITNVKPFVNSKGWEYIILLDKNGDFKRTMGVNMIPHTFILNSDGEVVWQHTSFSEGTELELIEHIKKVAKKGIVD